MEQICVTPKRTLEIENSKRVFATQQQQRESAK